MNTKKKSKQEIQIKLVSSAGFCFGVERAYRRARDTINKNSGTTIATIGPLIHNPQVVKQLEAEGVKVIDDLAELDEGILIVRSHGLSPQIIERAKKKGIQIVDATCPYVKKQQREATRSVESGYFVVLVGDAHHPEIKAVSDALGDNHIVVKDFLELQNKRLPDKIAILAQTTQNISIFREVVLFCIERCHEVKVFNTICDSTSTRQEMTQQLASQVDLMIIVGGRNSANTNRLMHLSRSIQPRTYLVEIADEIEPGILDGSVGSIGISAGASTPSWIIEQVVAKIRDLTEN